jgi:DNA-binding SARP family transcriptional activator
MDFRVLGPLEVYRDDQRVELGTRRRERCPLGVLLLEPGRLFSVERLVELLWDEEPPVQARSTVSNHVSRLRGWLDPDRSGRDGVRLIARGGGYLIDLKPDRVDANRFTTLVGHAQTLAEPADRSRVLRAALALWRGPLLADVGTDRLRSRLGVRLDELRLTAVETALRAELACGRTGPAAAELADLVEMHPDRERLLWLFMLALYRLGRQTQALAAYHRARERLADEFGLDLGAEVQALHEAILRGDPGLESVLGEGTAVAGVGVPVRPAQLPAPHRHFVGRTAQIRELDGLLAGQDGLTTVVISAIAGAAGIGKTAPAPRTCDSANPPTPSATSTMPLRKPIAPPDPEELSTIHLLRLDAVRAHLQLRQLDAANEMLHPVLALPPDLRNDPIIQRTSTVSDLLGKREWQATPLAGQLQEQIADFRADTAARRTLPPAQ